MRALGKGENASLKLFTILNLDKPVSHATPEKNTEKLIERSSEVTDSNMEITAKEVHSISNLIETLNLQVLVLTAHGTVEGGKLEKELLLAKLRRLGK